MDVDTRSSAGTRVATQTTMHRDQDTKQGLVRSFPARASGARGLLALVASILSLAACGIDAGTSREHADESSPGAAQGAARKFDGREVFRFDTFGDERRWTDVLRLHEVIESSIDPMTALAVGLKVDADALPPDFLATADLSSPATTVELLRRNAVVGLVGKVVGRGRLVEVGITCALCHSIVDDTVQPGVGHRLDGFPNRDLDPGLIISLSPALSDAQREVYESWGPGRYDPRFNVDGINHPVLIPPAYGLQGVALETYTGDGPISYWNAYVAITQMGGKGDFSDPRIGVSVDFKKDLVTPKLPALLDYQLSLAKPPPPPDSFDIDAAARGRAVFEGAAGCASCHRGSTFTDAGQALHAATETGMDPLYASRSATGLYRTTPLRALWQHAPYFHDGFAETLDEVVDHYDAFLGLGLTADDRRDLIEYLKSI
jgi:mono/diheme cytochrome c family protein